MCHNRCQCCFKLQSGLNDVRMEFEKNCIIKDRCISGCNRWITKDKISGEQSAFYFVSRLHYVYLILHIKCLYATLIGSKLTPFNPFRSSGCNTKPPFNSRLWCGQVVSSSNRPRFLHCASIWRGDLKSVGFPVVSFTSSIYIWYI